MVEIESVVTRFGFDLFGIVPITKSRNAEQLDAWLAHGMYGNMEWMARESSVAKRKDPLQIMPEAKRLLVLAYQYTPPVIPVELLNDPSRGIIARYALYNDYHDLIENKIELLVGALQQQHGEFSWKAYIDTGPILEREWATTAGLGFIGRNSNLINSRLGSYLFLAEVLVDTELPVTEQVVKRNCARCNSCRVKCPTQAIVQDKVIDARLCISYQTIESKACIPEELRPLLKNRIYGCDICQEVCPWNKNVAAQTKADFKVRPELIAPPLKSLLFFTDQEFHDFFRKSPIKRVKREGFMRNVSVALGNWGSAEAKVLLEQIIKNDPSDLVREHGSWGLGRIRE